MKIIKRFDFEEIIGFKFAHSPFGKPAFGSIVYFVDGLLIDTGHRLMKRDVIQTLRDLPVQQIFITHHHEDHTGNLNELQQHFGCPVYASSACAKLMQNPPSISPAQKMTWGDRPASFVLEAIAGTIKTENYSFDLHPIPGHAEDMLALYEPNQKWLFSADLYLNRYIGYFLQEENIHQQISSIKKILKLDFEALICSHNPVFEGGKEKLKQKQVFLEKFREEVSSLHQRGLSSKEILREIYMKENWFIRITSLGRLSLMNMVKSVLRE